MIASTTPTLEGRRIVECVGLVSGEAVMPAHYGYEKGLKNARDVALGEMTKKAAARGANAVVGVDLDYEVLGDRRSMLRTTVMVLADGTAVVVE